MLQGQGSSVDQSLSGPDLSLMLRLLLLRAAMCGNDFQGHLLHAMHQSPVHRAAAANAQAPLAPTPGLADDQVASAMPAAGIQ